MTRLIKEDLKTIPNFADIVGCKRQYIHQLIKEKKIFPVDIDGVKFIDIKHTKVELRKK